MELEFIKNFFRNWSFTKDEMDVIMAVDKLDRGNDYLDHCAELLLNEFNNTDLELTNENLYEIFRVTFMGE